jgi:hypothetical protein
MCDLDGNRFKQAEYRSKQISGSNPAEQAFTIDRTPCQLPVAMMGSDGQ